MEKLLQPILRIHNISTHRNQGILIVPVPDQATGLRVAKDILYELVDKRTALFLSGGKTPKSLLTRLTQEKKLHPGIVGQVDERFGKPFHETSNELMFQETGFLDYLRETSVKFAPMLQKNSSRDHLAEEYDQLLRSLFTVYSRSVATLGIGEDGHIAGMAPNRPGFTNPLFMSLSSQQLIAAFDDSEGPFKERITMTFLGLSMMDYVIPIVFGEDKKEALEKLFENGKEEEIPARFLKRSEIAKKTIIITDQQV